MKKQNNYILILYLTVLVLELFGEVGVELLDNANLVYVTKPLLMPLLMIYLYRSNKEKSLSRFQNIILVSLFFSWLGDLFLMLTWTGQNLFLFGLSAFLIAHLLYIAGFQLGPKAERSFLKRMPYAALPVVLYTVGLVYTLFQNGNEEFMEMKVPAMIYAAVIMVMILAALNRNGRVAERSFQLVFWGALIFMFSDSLIAVGKFTTTFEDSPILIRIMIMFTYGLGQLLIIQGCVVQGLREKKA